MFAFDTDLATQGIIFQSAFLKVNAWLFRNCRPSLFGSAATTLCIAFPKNISIMLDMGIYDNGIGLLPAYRMNLATPCRRHFGATLALQLVALSSTYDVAVPIPILGGSDGFHSLP